MSRPLSAGLSLTLSGVSPCAIFHRISPLSRSMAVMLPYGGFPSGSPLTLSPATASAPASVAAAVPATVRPPPAEEPLPPVSRAPAIALPEMYRMSENPAGGGTSPIVPIAPVEYTYARCVSGSYDPPFQFVPASALVSRPIGPSILLTTGGVNIGPILYFFTSSTASERSAGVKSIRPSIETPVRSYHGGFVGNRCVGAYHSPGTSSCGTGRSSIAQIGWPGSRLKTYSSPRLV